MISVYYQNTFSGKHLPRTANNSEMLRQEVEKCGSLQGFQIQYRKEIMMDMELYDYDKKNVMTFCTIDGVESGEELQEIDDYSH